MMVIFTIFCQVVVLIVSRSGDMDTVLEIQSIHTAIRKDDVTFRLCDANAPFIAIWFGSDRDDRTVTDVDDGGFESGIQEFFNSDINRKTFGDATDIQACAWIGDEDGVGLIIDFNEAPTCTGLGLLE